MTIRFIALYSTPKDFSVGYRLTWMATLHCGRPRASRDSSSGYLPSRLKSNCRVTQLPRLPTLWVAPAVEARDDHNPVLLNLKEYSVGEEPHSRTATAPVDDRELHWMFRDCLNRRLDCQREALPKLGANVVIP